MEEDKWERTWRWLGGVTSLASSRPEVGFPGTRLIAYLPLARDLECFFPVPYLVLPRGVFGELRGVPASEPGCFCGSGSARTASLAGIQTLTLACLWLHSFPVAAVSK